MKIRLSTKLISSVVVIEAVMLSVLVWNSVRLISSSHAERLEDRTHEGSIMLASLLAPGLAANDLAILQDSLSLIGHEEEIVYVRVLGLDDRPIASIGKSPARVNQDRTFSDAKKDGTFDVTQDIGLFGQRLGTLQVGYSTAEVEALIRKTRLQNTAIAFVEIALSIMVTLLLGYFLTRSLRQLEEGTKALTRDELHHRINVDSRDEMGDLARSFNRLGEHLSTTRDELAREHDALTQQSRRLQTLLDGVNAVIIEFDPVLGQFGYVSKEAEHLLGYPDTEWRNPGFLYAHMHSDDLPRYTDQLATHLDEPGSFSIDFRMTHRNGHEVWVRSVNTLERTASATMTCRGLLLDITEQKQSENRIVYLAEHDAMTGLFNRHRFQEELERELEHAGRFNYESALMFIDLDQFKYINDTLGHLTGDDYLTAISHRLSGRLRKVDTLGRLGGDEFGVILPNSNQEQAEGVAASLLRGLATENTGIGNLNTPVSASIGIVIFPIEGATPGNLLAMADAAMYRAKDSGRNGYHVYRDGDQTLLEMQAKLTWEKRIRTALEQDGFVLYYQPIQRLDRRTVVHYEVLLRMSDNNGGLIAPGAFLDVAERFGLIRDIDKWVLRNAIRVQARSEDDPRPLSLAINLSGRHLGNPEVLEWIRQEIRDSGADPARLIFEITETAAVENIEQAKTFVDALHDLGCRIALDDFGVGFSSFHYLKHLPVDMIKLDGSFIRNLTGDSFDRVFVKAMNDMVMGLGISSVAEFVEAEEIVTILQTLGVAMGQGYHLAKPASECPFPCDLLPAQGTAPRITRV